MIVSIHQPHFLPWMGYFNKLLHSDVFVWLQSVQYRKNYYQNRTRVKNVTGQPLWLTLPVRVSLGMRIDEVMIAEPRWQDRVCRTVEHCYKRTPFFEDCWSVLSSSFRVGSDNLEEVNYTTFRALLRLLGGDHVRVVRDVDLGLSSVDPTVRLVEACSLLGATHYIAGKGGHNYLRGEEFERANIDVIWQMFDPEQVLYQQSGHTFVCGLSVIDCLFNEGPARARDLILEAWTPPREEYTTHVSAV